MSQSPIPAVPVLNYAGPIVLQRPAFNVRRSWMWKGEHLFRVYLTPTQAWFIRIGGAKNNAAAIGYQGGLIGMLIAAWMNKRAKKKSDKKAVENEDKPLEQLITEHKRNHVINLVDVSISAIESAGYWSAGIIRWSFDLAGEQKRVKCALDQTVDVDAALQCLATVFPDLRVAVEYNERKKKYLKVK